MLSPKYTKDYDTSWKDTNVESHRAEADWSYRVDYETLPSFCNETLFTTLNPHTNICTVKFSALASLLGLVSASRETPHLLLQKKTHSKALPFSLP